MAEEHISLKQRIKNMAGDEEVDPTEVSYLRWKNEKNLIIFDHKSKILKNDQDKWKFSSFSHIFCSKLTIFL